MASPNDMLQQRKRPHPMWNDTGALLLFWQIRFLKYYNS